MAILIIIAKIVVVLTFIILVATLFEGARVFFTSPIKARVTIVSIKDGCIKVRREHGELVEIYNWPKIEKPPFTIGNRVTILYWPPFLVDRKARFGIFYPVAL